MNRDGSGIYRVGFAVVWIFGGIAQQIKRDAEAGALAAKALWRKWMAEYWPRLPRPVRAPLFAVGVSVRAVYRAGRYGGRSIAIGVRNGLEEGHERHREFLELREHPPGTSGYVHVSQRIATDRQERADGYRMYGEQVHGAAAQRRDERSRWARARTLAELGELTAQWAEGRMKYHPGGYDEGPAEETLEISGALATLNRAGFVTSGSQPGMGPEIGFDGNTWWQRAAVDGYTDSATADRLEAACEEAGLVCIRNGPAQWRTSWKNSMTTTASTLGGEDINSCSGHYAHTSFGTHLSRRAVKFDFDGYGVDALLKAEQVTIIDPEWGRTDYLWQTIASDAHIPAAGRSDAAGEPESSHVDGQSVPMLTSASTSAGDEDELDGGQDATPPYPVDDNGFPFDHVTYQAHTMPDDTYSWGCLKSGCFNGLPEYATEDESLAAARDHELKHGYARTTASWTVIDVQDLRPGQRILVGPGNVQTVAHPTERDEYGGAIIHTDQSRILTRLPCPVKVMTHGDMVNAGENNNGGEEMTAPSFPTHTGAGCDVNTVEGFRRAYEEAAQASSVIHDELLRVAEQCDKAVAMHEAQIGAMTSDEFGQDTIAEASAAMEAMQEMARAIREAAASADAAQAVQTAAQQGTERHRAMEEAVQSAPGGPAKSTASYAAS